MYGHPGPYVGQTPFLGTGLGLLGGLFGLLVTIAVITLVVLVVVKVARGHKQHAIQVHTPGESVVAPAAPVAVAEDEALRIARERLARGEIDPDQYRAIVEVLAP